MILKRNLLGEKSRGQQGMKFSKDMALGRV